MIRGDKWCVLKIGDVYKVLLTWNGSYIYGGSWQLNSGIVKVEDKEDYYIFHGVSGSEYQCYKGQYGEVCNSGWPHSIKPMEEDTDWTKLIKEEEEV